MVEAFRIRGGNKLKGVLKASGAKNAALPIIIGTLIERGTYILKNVPDLRDIRTLIQLLESLGMKVERLDKNSYKFVNEGLTNLVAAYDLVKKMRASFLVMGPMLAHAKEARVSLPGGCAIGSRPVDLHLKGFEAMGVDITLDHGYVEAKAKDGKLTGASVVFDFPSVGATENVIMAAVKADGITTLDNVAREPEVEDLCNFLNSMGAKISGIGSSKLTIEGVEKLVPGEYTIMPDRIEAGTYIVGALMFDGEIEVEGVIREHIESFISKLEEMGAVFEIKGTHLKVISKLEDLNSAKVKTMPHPGFATDLQSQMMTLMCLVKGTSEVKETIFENRFMHVPELNRMGASIDIEDHVAVVEGVKTFSSAEVMASDLRAGASLVLAALKAEGESIVNRIYHVDRGYEQLEEKLKAIGADIERIKMEA